MATLIWLIGVWLTFTACGLAMIGVVLIFRSIVWIIVLPFRAIHARRYVGPPAFGATGIKSLRQWHLGQ